METFFLEEGRYEFLQKKKIAVDNQMISKVGLRQGHKLLGWLHISVTE